MNARCLWPVTLGALLAGMPALAVAQAVESVPVPVSASAERALITDSAGHQASGRTAVNQAAGVGNAQSNLAALALADRGPALVGLQSQQRVTGGDRARNASARIDGNAFSDSQGLLSINQAAGGGNAQTNLFVIGNGALVQADQRISGLDDAALAAVAGEQPIEATEISPWLREAVIADDAFRGSQGVVQVNQTAGIGNSSVNAIVLQLPGGAP